jgi:7,8-dihydropterin-6-yl-methyl-4-(beta-D-ribofuranosyl)aminobenzene 5'-phosphate synthase
MPRSFSRRNFLGCSVAFGSAFACSAVAPGTDGEEAPRIAPPAVDEVKIEVVVDGAHDVFISGAQVPGVKIERTRLFSGLQVDRTLLSEWGLALHLQSRIGEERRRYLLDFGYTAEALANNIELLGIDVRAIDALILSHGHQDHFGGLAGFLAKYRASMREDLRLYIGGEEVFCHRYRNLPDGGFADGGVLDRRALAAANVELAASELPIVMASHAFTTGIVPRVSSERVLPNTFEAFGVKDGVGCDVQRYAGHHFTAAELSGQPQPDQHLHEHATCFNVRDRGLLVVTSCGHGGIVNTVRRARQVTGIDKVHALVGGFHLAPASPDYLAQVMAELKPLDIDYLFPMHCSGANFIEAAKREMPTSLVACTTGSRFTFGQQI